jgi:hypothetical protein
VHRDPIPIQAVIEADEARITSLKTARGNAFSEWRKSSNLFMDKLGFPAEYKGWTQSSTFVGKGLPQLERVRSLVNCGWAKRLSSVPYGTPWADAKIGWFCNVSQSVDRAPFGRFQSLCQSSAIYSYELDSMLSGVDNVSSLGFSHRAALQAARTLTDAELKSLSGEGFAMPCVGLIAYVYFLNPSGCWWKAA